MTSKQNARWNCKRGVRKKIELSNKDFPNIQDVKIKNKRRIKNQKTKEKENQTNSISGRVEQGKTESKQTRAPMLRKRVRLFLIRVAGSIERVALFCLHLVLDDFKKGENWIACW